MINDVTELGQNSQSKGLLRFVILVEDIKPRGMKLLGTFLNIDPRVFERLLNVKREYTNGLADVHVLDYCQGYIYRNSLGAKVFSNFQDKTLETLKLNGKLRRWWRDIVGHEQRIVVAAVAKTQLIPVPTDIIFFRSLPKKTSLEFMPSAAMGSKKAFVLQSFDSPKDFPSFFQFQTDFSDVVHQLSKQGTSDNMAAIKSTIYEALDNKEIPAHLKALSGATTFIAAKWTSLVDQIQEVISETDIPDATSLPLLRIMIKRKHMFSEVKRTLATLRENITAPELSTIVGSLKSVGKKLDDWIRDLESTISLCSNYLSLDESQRAITRSTRTGQLTVLAFVFIPISAVASAFGMNVNVLINNPLIYWFAGVGAGVALITFSYAIYFQQINKGVVLISFYLLSLALDIIITILKFIALPFCWILITLGSPLILLFYFLFVDDLTNAWPGYLLAIVDAAWFLLAMYWNHSATILQWSPPFLDIRLEWRAGKKLPKVPELDGDLELAPRKERDTGSCVVM
ncbi:hypothetical protein NA56DRAFT_438367 [Hyaloscypha hepaticicola]|uniref:Cora-domain-containing protein n=1 Tax=Hyaloscypha hepaticicola TaxID=2082293 RepID=A0A2J6QGZ1_9HELO|nr:hypothetical protein NA56DRAFT_438367 [Hyaloscypha hepaticicola]